MRRRFKLVIHDVSAVDSGAATMAQDALICLLGDLALAHLRLLADEVFGSENYVNTVSVQTKLSAGVSGGGEDKRLKKHLEYVIIYARNINAAPKLTHMVRRVPLLEQIISMRQTKRSFKYTNVFTHLGAREHVQTIADGRGHPVEIYRRSGCTRSTIKQLIRQEQVTEKDTYLRYFESVFRDTSTDKHATTRC